MILMLSVLLMLCFGSTISLGRFPEHKTWWAKYITDDLYVSGRPTELQLKYTCDDGFKSIVSLSDHVKPEPFGSEMLVSSSTATNIIYNFCGQKFLVLCMVPDDRSCLAPGIVGRFSLHFEKLPKPVLLYSEDSFNATFIALLHAAKQHSEKGESGVREFYRRAGAMGYDFTSSELVNVVESVTGEKVVDPPKPDLAIPDWYKKYWMAKPLLRDWFVAGQVRRDHLPLLHKLGINVLLNSRMGVTMEGDPTQEDVALLNVNDEVFTYEGEGRQCEAEILAHRVDDNKPTDFISPDSEVNYICQNYEEFGDDIGYNETEQRLAMVDQPFQYIHTPVGGSIGIDENLWLLYKETWLDADKNGPVLAHCRMAYRAVVSAIATVGWKEGRDLDWALETARLHGFHFDMEEDPDVARLFRYVFVKHRKEEL